MNSFGPCIHIFPSLVCKLSRTFNVSHLCDFHSSKFGSFANPRTISKHGSSCYAPSSSPSIVLPPSLTNNHVLRHPAHWESNEDSPNDSPNESHDRSLVLLHVLYIDIKTRGAALKRRVCSWSTSKRAS